MWNKELIWEKINHLMEKNNHWKYTYLHIFDVKKNSSNHYWDKEFKCNFRKDSFQKSGDQIEILGLASLNFEALFNCKSIAYFNKFCHLLHVLTRWVLRVKLTPLNGRIQLSKSNSLRSCFWHFDLLFPTRLPSICFIY